MDRLLVQVVFPAMPDMKDMVLVIPFPTDEDEMILHFNPDILTRLGELGAGVTSTTHKCTLHLDSETGPAFSINDYIDRVPQTGDKLVAVVTEYARKPKALE
ncbi:unnamed protein product [Zymoseptoria tritici ST99CH_1E4]|uniref:Uncharacterized protein n=1 Tax=Zymoseptoria tritici ST99CH_1E4 TaxID=1276532 RepID=A0A2H1GNH1_ZYMTR|nr:unnamed protein product [Zymoseptoria tritici ST99CH_1E4]